MIKKFCLKRSSRGLLVSHEVEVSNPTTYDASINIERKSNKVATKHVTPQKYPFTIFLILSFATKP